MVVGAVALLVAGGWRADLVTVPARVTEPAAADGLATIRYSDLDGKEHIVRIGVGDAPRNGTVEVLLAKDAPDAPMLEGSLKVRAIRFAPYLILAGALIPFAGVPALFVRLEKSGKVMRVLGSPPVSARFSWHADQTVGRSGFKGRISPLSDVGKERVVALGTARPPIGNDTHDVVVFGDLRGPDPLVVVGQSWTLVALR